MTPADAAVLIASVSAGAVAIIGAAVAGMVAWWSSQRADTALLLAGHTALIASLTLDNQRLREELNRALTRIAVLEEQVGQTRHGGLAGAP